MTQPEINLQDKECTRCGQKWSHHDPEKCKPFPVSTCCNASVKVISGIPCGYTCEVCGKICELWNKPKPESSTQDKDGNPIWEKPLCECCGKPIDKILEDREKRKPLSEEIKKILEGLVNNYGYAYSEGKDKEIIIQTLSAILKAVGDRVPKYKEISENDTDGDVAEKEIYNQAIAQKKEGTLWLNLGDSYNANYRGGGLDTCGGCAYQKDRNKLLANGYVAWYSTQPHPCNFCLRFPKEKMDYPDNFQEG